MEKSYKRMGVTFEKKKFYGLGLTVFGFFACFKFLNCSFFHFGKTMLVPKNHQKEWLWQHSWVLLVVLQSVVF